MDFDGKPIETVLQLSLVCCSSTVQSFRRGVGDDGNTRDSRLSLEVLHVIAVIGHLDMIQGGEVTLSSQ